MAVLHLKNFTSEEQKRIFPALFFTIISTLPLAYYLLSQKAFVEYKESLIASTFFTQIIILKS